MKSLTTLQILQDAPVIPVIVINDEKHAIPLASALVSGGIRMLEVTLRTAASLGAIERISNEVPEAIVGAGTVCNQADADAALRAGARFVVSPGYTAVLGRYCRQIGLPLLPGVSTPSEIMMAMEDGYSELKFFPAMQSGGVAMLKAFSGPFEQIRFCPTGGISSHNAGEFLALQNVVCVGGSWLAPSDLMVSGHFTQITAFAREAKALRRHVL
ncbi:MAG: bifunctional 4-hydroxy-2-oxoglutarate aldolase/2-dehydro-3-deoxy-phosphogluconate aldolase [Sheuella sp.]|nr:bifunctional 4-hydroxy-2-oxoglutarate aldolase/2-dehydro-3-deoxy-phosphogluconate aldolase [Sheuella sp.]